MTESDISETFGQHKRLLIPSKHLLVCQQESLIKRKGFTTLKGYRLQRLTAKLRISSVRAWTSGVYTHTHTHAHTHTHTHIYIYIYIYIRFTYESNVMQLF